MSGQLLLGSGLPDADPLGVWATSRARDKEQVWAHGQHSTAASACPCRWLSALHPWRGALVAGATNRWQGIAPAPGCSARPGWQWLPGLQGSSHRNPWPCNPGHTTRCLQGILKPALQRLRDGYTAKARELGDLLLSLQEQADSVRELLAEREEENRNAEAQVWAAARAAIGAVPYVVTGGRRGASCSCGLRRPARAAGCGWRACWGVRLVWGAGARKRAPCWTLSG